MFTRLSGFLLLCAFAVSYATAAPVYGTNTNIQLNSSRSETGGGITTTGDYLTDGLNMTLSWLIVDNLNGTWNYQYTVTGMTDPAVSHFILDLTDDCVGLGLGANACLTSVSVTGGADLELGTYDGPGQPNPGMPGPITGIKFDETNFSSGGVISFTTSRAPVWGDFFFKGGGSGAFNTGLDPSNRLSDNINLFVARPNGDGLNENAVPEPSSMMLIGAGLAGIAFLRRRR